MYTTVTTNNRQLDLRLGSAVESDLEDALSLAHQLDNYSVDDQVALVHQWLESLTGDAVVELRALEAVTSNYRRPHTIAGYFDAEHREQMAEEALRLSYCARGVYFTLNPLKRDALARCCNRTQEAAQGSLSRDTDIACRRLLLIDFDPARLEGISSSEEEKKAALEKALEVRDHLRGRNWSDPFIADSGNGIHLLYRIDLPAADNDLVKRILQGMASRFDDAAVHIDQKVFNAGRICKLYGTRACKGDDVPERPHRRTVVLQHGGDQPVSLQQLEEIASAAPPQQGRRAMSHGGQTDGGTTVRKPADSRILKRAAAYVNAIPSAISGNDGHNQTFKAACAMVLGFDLGVDEALPLLQVWNLECQPPWTESELLHKLVDADKVVTRRGYLL